MCGSAFVMHQGISAAARSLIEESISVYLEEAAGAKVCTFVPENNNRKAKPFHNL